MLTLLPVERDERAFAAHRGHADRLEPVAVEGVGRLGQLEHGVVGQVDQQVVRPLVQGVQPSLDRPAAKAAVPATRNSMHP